MDDNSQEFTRAIDQTLESLRKMASIRNENRLKKITSLNQEYKEKLIFIEKKSKYFHGIENGVGQKYSHHEHRFIDQNEWKSLILTDEDKAQFSQDELRSMKHGEKETFDWCPKREQYVKQSEVLELSVDERKDLSKSLHGHQKDGKLYSHTEGTYVFKEEWEPLSQTDYKEYQVGDKVDLVYDANQNAYVSEDKLTKMESNEIQNESVSNQEGTKLSTKHGQKEKFSYSKEGNLVSQKTNPDAPEAKVSYSEYGDIVHGEKKVLAFDVTTGEYVAPELLTELDENEKQRFGEAAEAHGKEDIVRFDRDSQQYVNEDTWVPERVENATILDKNLHGDRKEKFYSSEQDRYVSKEILKPRLEKNLVGQDLKDMKTLRRDSRVLRKKRVAGHRFSADKNKFVRERLPNLMLTKSYAAVKGSVDATKKVSNKLKTKNTTQHNL